MKLFVVCEDIGYYSGRIFAHQLGVRLAGKYEVDCGSVEDLDNKRANNVSYRYVLNMGATKRFSAGAQVLNDVTSTINTNDRRICRMKLKLKRLPAPTVVTQFKNVTPYMLPIIGRRSEIGNDVDFWSCYTMAQVNAANNEGATHFVQRINNNREFRVHVVSPDLNVFSTPAHTFRVLKVSERFTTNTELARLNPENKKLNPHYFFGAPKDMGSRTVTLVTELGRRAVKEFNLHWGTASIVVGTEGVPLVTKVDSYINMREDQTNIIARFSNGVAKLFCENPKPLIRGGSLKHV